MLGTSQCGKDAQSLSPISFTFPSWAKLHMPSFNIHSPSPIPTTLPSTRSQCNPSIGSYRLLVPPSHSHHILASLARHLETPSLHGEPPSHALPPLILPSLELSPASILQRKYGPSSRSCLTYPRSCLHKAASTGETLVSFVLPFVHFTCFLSPYLKL